MKPRYKAMLITRSEYSNLPRYSKWDDPAGSRWRTERGKNKLPVIARRELIDNVLYDCYYVPMFIDGCLEVVDRPDYKRLATMRSL